MKLLRFFLCKVGGEGFKGDGLPIFRITKSFVIQKIFGFNRAVSWPVHSSSRIVAPEKINRGTRYPGLSMGCHVDGRNGIIFGENVWMGPRVSVISMNHSSTNFHKYIDSDPIVIGNNCLLCANSVILPGVEIGEHTIVSAGCVVTKSFKEGNQVLAGVPAKVVKKIEPYESKV